MGIISDALELQMENKRLITKIKELERQRPVVYKVYDDEWDTIMGEQQIREFALMQLTENYENYKDYHNGGGKLAEIWDKISDTAYTLTIDDVNAIFEAFDFYYEQFLPY